MAHLTDDDLPGMWSHGDFEGGDPDERSYAQRVADGEEGWRQRWITGMNEAQHLEHLASVDRAVRELAAITKTPWDDEPVGYDGFGAPLYAHQLPPEGTE